MPDRIQRKRTKAWKMPTNAIYVGRPTRWGNPYADQDNAELVRLFRENCLTPEFICSVKSELKGKDLACWCPPRRNAFRRGIKKTAQPRAALFFLLNSNRASVPKNMG